MKKNEKGIKLIGPKVPPKRYTRTLRKATQTAHVGGSKSKGKEPVHFRDEEVVIASVFYTHLQGPIGGPQTAGIDTEMSRGHEITYGELGSMSARTFLGAFFSRPGALRFYEVYMCFSRDARSEKKIKLDRKYLDKIFNDLWEAAKELDRKASLDDVDDILETVNDVRRPIRILRPITSLLSSDEYELREGAAGRRVMMNPDNGIVPRLSWEELKIHRASQYAGLNPKRAAFGELAPFKDACGYILMETERYANVVGMRLYIETEPRGEYEDWLDETGDWDFAEDYIERFQGGLSTHAINHGFYLRSGVFDDVDFAPRYTVQDVMRQVIGRGKDPAGDIDWRRLGIETGNMVPDDPGLKELRDEMILGIVMYNIRETYDERLPGPLSSPYLGAIFFESYLPIIVKVGSAVTEPSLLQPFDEEEGEDLDQPFVAWHHTDRRDARGRLAQSLFDPQSTIASVDFRDEPVIRDRTVTLWFRVRIAANEFDTPERSPVENRTMFHGRSGQAMLSEIFADDVVPVEYYRDVLGEDPTWRHAAMENMVLWNRKTPGRRHRQVVDPETGRSRTLSESASWSPDTDPLDMMDGEAVVYGVGVPLLSVKSFGSMIRDDYDYARANKNPACLSVYRTAPDLRTGNYSEDAVFWRRMPVQVTVTDYKAAQAEYKRLTTNTSPSHALVLETSDLDAHAETVLGIHNMNRLLMHVLMTRDEGHENLELVTEPLPPLPVVKGFSIFGNLMSRFAAVGQDIGSPGKRPTGKDPTSVFDLL